MQQNSFAREPTNVLFIAIFLKVSVVYFQNDREMDYFGVALYFLLLVK